MSVTALGPGRPGPLWALGVLDLFGRWASWTPLGPGPLWALGVLDPPGPWTSLCPGRLWALGVLDPPGPWTSLGRVLLGDMVDHLWIN